jgi:hypothetical protein
MKVSEQHINLQLARAQKFLWGGSETENIKAHNIIAKLLKDLGVDELPDHMLESEAEEE